MPRSMARTTQRTTERTTQPVATSRTPSTIPPARPPHTAGIAGSRPANGTVRECTPLRGEILRHRVMSADGRDVAITTTRTAHGYTNRYATGVYPVQNGYLVMVCQPLFETESASAEAAREQHEQLVRVLAELGVRVVRARRFRDQRMQAEGEADAADEIEQASSVGATA